MKRIAALLAALMLVGSLTAAGDGAPGGGMTGAPAAAPTAGEAADLEIEAKSCLLMEAQTGRVLYAENADESLPPASVTKIMSLLLVMEAIDDGRISFDDVVQCSAAAAGKGGSQVYLAEGEMMTVRDLVKCVAVASANDATACLAEYVAGSEAAFVTLMNERAEALGLTGTSFVNCSGLDDDGTNLTTASDVAVMSRELISHEGIFQFTTIWMDSIRDGTFGLSNTNKLVRFYSGTNGLKTGFTPKAGFCISATAVREGMQLIAVIMGSETAAIRNEQAKKLLDYGFANWAVAVVKRPESFDDVPVAKGVQAQVTPVMRADSVALLVARGQRDNVTSRVELAEGVTAPVAEGQELGGLICELDGTVLCRVPLVAGCAVERVSFGFLMKSIWSHVLI